MFAWLATIPWYVWVIVAMAAALIAVICLAYAALRGAGNIVASTWIKGNFGKRRT